MTSIEFFPITIDYETNKIGKPIIQIFGKTIDGKRICVMDESFQNYFWVLTHKETSKLRNKIEAITIKKGEKVAFVTKTELHEKNHLNQSIQAIKVFTNHPEDVSEIKEEILEPCRETDIPFIRRYLIDKKITPLKLCKVEGELIKTDFDVDYTIKAKKIEPLTEEFQNPKILAFDIEVLTKIKGYPNEKKDPIISISFAGSGIAKVITWKKFKTNLDYVKFVESEADLITEFKKIIKEYKPDFLTGYNSNNFDLPYIKERAKKYDIKLNIGLNNTNIKFSRSGRKVKIDGIVNIDIFRFIKGVIFESLQTDTYSLNSVAKELLGKGKDEFDFKTLEEKFKNNDLDELCQYNLKDSILTLELCKKILPNLEEMVKLVALPITDVSTMSFSQLVEWYILRNLNQFNEIAPNRPDYKEIRQRRLQTYKGAFVLKPTAGLYENIVILDYRSLYPSIIVAKNICLSTLTENREGSNKTPDIIMGNEEQNFYFNYKKDGVVPQIIKELITRRIRIKELIKKNPEDLILKARSQSLKTLTNAAYGYFGFFAARYYSIECAASITAFGREFISDTIKKAEQSGFKVIYSDTDSIAIILENKTKEQILDFLDKINTELPSLMELEFEGFYPKGIFVLKKDEQAGAKKKYALLKDDGKLIIKGFETVRRDWSELAREAQINVLNIILKENNIEKAKKYIIDLINETKQNQIPLEKTIMQTQLKKDIDDYVAIGPHVAIARQMKNQGIDIRPGTIIEYIVTQGLGLVRDRAKTIEDAKNYDPDYYINNQIIPSVEMIFNVLNIKKEDLLSDKNQSTLGDF